MWYLTILLPLVVCSQLPRNGNSSASDLQYDYNGTPSSHAISAQQQLDSLERAIVELPYLIGLFSTTDCDFVFLRSYSRMLAEKLSRMTSFNEAVEWIKNVLDMLESFLDRLELTDKDHICPKCEFHNLNKFLNDSVFINTAKIDDPKQAVDQCEAIFMSVVDRCEIDGEGESRAAVQVSPLELNRVLYALLKAVRLCTPLPVSEENCQIMAKVLFLGYSIKARLGPSMTPNILTKVFIDSCSVNVSLCARLEPLSSPFTDPKRKKWTVEHLNQFSVLFKDRLAELCCATLEQLTVRYLPSLCKETSRDPERIKSEFASARSLLTKLHSLANECSPCLQSTIISAKCEFEKRLDILWDKSIVAAERQKSQLIKDLNVLFGVLKEQKSKRAAAESALGQCEDLKVGALERIANSHNPDVFVHCLTLAVSFVGSLSDKAVRREYTANLSTFINRFISHPILENSQHDAIGYIASLLDTLQSSTVHDDDFE